MTTTMLLSLSRCRALTSTSHTRRFRTSAHSFDECKITDKSSDTSSSRPKQPRSEKRISPGQELERVATRLGVRRYREWYPAQSRLAHELSQVRLSLDDDDYSYTSDYYE